MRLTPVVSVSVVLYKNNLEEISKLLSSFSQCSIQIIYIVDNSPSDDLNDLFKSDSRVKYMHYKANLGFGAAHNIAIAAAINFGSDYHFIVNPDIYYDRDVMNPMVQYMDHNNDIGMMMPKILNVDGTVQYMPKLLPSPFSIFMRKFKWPQFYYQNFIKRYELRLEHERIFNTPLLSGCFTLLRLSAIKEVGMYDNAYFMYFEDWDLSRRMYLKYKTIYFPQVSVYHGYDSGANNNSLLFKIFVSSAIKYFTKWGWFFDKNRQKINDVVLAQFK